VSGSSPGENEGFGFSKGGAADLVSKGRGCRRKGFRFFLLFSTPLVNFLRLTNSKFFSPPLFFTVAWYL